MVENGSITSRRCLLRAAAFAPLVVGSRWDAALAALPHSDAPIVLRRTRAGRRDSRFRYHNAESFFRGFEERAANNPHDELYQIGIVLQLAFSSHLLDVGFTDQWCARHIGMKMSRSLAYANATGFGFERAEFAPLAGVLSPYSKWPFPQSCLRAQELTFTPEQIRTLTRSLLDHVHRVTGHSRPTGWNARHA